MIRAVLVDDEPPARLRLRQMLAEAGDVVIVGEAGDADEARAAVEATRPDVVFLDIEMPETRGTAFAASLAEPRPFIVFATAYDRYAIEAFAHGATDYLLKPVTRARLASTLDRVRGRLSQSTDIEREVRSASAVQAALMPRTLPSIEGVSAAAETVPARGVGGDFYDAFVIDPGRAAFVLADASGKGMPAGLVASSLQALVRSGARHAPPGAGALMAQLNRDVFAMTDGARYATLIYAELDVETRTLLVVNAGHPAPVLVASDGRAVDAVGSTGPALGMLPEASYAARTLTLGAGSTFVAVSDGVTEAFNPAGEEFGEARLAATLREARAEPPGEVCRRIVDAVRLHRSTAPVQDDLTVLVIRGEKTHPPA
jgi:sigma-B regulation protein RsbU (phosphoserine phosphatase)